LAEGNRLEDATLGERVAVAAALDDFETPGTNASAEETARRKVIAERQRKGFLLRLSSIAEAGDETQEDKEEKKHWKKFNAFMYRLSMALFGGYALIIPMLIMYLHASKLTSLLTTSVFVIAVAVYFAALLNWEPKDIIGATAAYAAVLVVFVGTSAPPSNLSDGKIAGIVVGVVCGLYVVIALGAPLVIGGPTIRRAIFNAVRNGGGLHSEIEV
jgi:hypothetical protein